MAIIRNIPSERIIHGKLITTSEIAIVSEQQFRTRGEGIVIVKNNEPTKIILDGSTTDKISIKALSQVLIIPNVGKIDEDFDEILLDKGSCVEFAFCSGNWYIISSDGLKMGE
jgi:hypothetical protein